MPGPSPVGVDPTSVATRMPSIRSAFRVTTNRDGLPQNTITAMTLDTRGYLWIATQDGAARFNGHRWVQVDLPTSAGSNFLRAIASSKDGSVWFGTREGGVSRLKDGEWTTLDASKGLPDNSVRSLLETVATDGSPTMWIGTERGLASYRDGEIEVYGLAAGLPGSTVNCLTATVPDRGEPVLWAGTNGGLGRFAEGAWQTFGTASGLPHANVTSLLQVDRPDGTSSLWAGTAGGLARLEADRFVPVDLPSPLPSSEVTSLAQVARPNGTATVLVGTPRGLAGLDNSVMHLYDTRSGLPSDGILSILSHGSPAGTRSVFVGTSAGLVQWEMNSWMIVDMRSGLPSNVVFSILETVSSAGDAVLWIGTESGLARWGSNGWTVYTTANGLPNDRVLCLLESQAADGTSALWVGTSGGLARLERGQWTIFETDSGLPNPGIRCLLETLGPDGRRTLWAGTYGGLARFDGTAWSAYTVESGLPDNGVLSLHETSLPGEPATLWVGTYRGLARIEEGAIVPLGTAAGLPAAGVRTILSTRSATGRRQLWVGLAGAGAAFLDLDAEGSEWHRLADSSTPSLPNNSVYQILEDARRRLYVTTNRGIVQLTPRVPTADDPAEFSAVTFTTDDGLPNNECNSGASTVDRLGRLWVGTVAGAAVYDPSAEPENPPASPLFIESALVSSDRSPIQQAAKLEHHQSQMVFEYALVAFARSQAVRYSTQLEGFDTTRTAWSSDTRREYTNLPAGSYAFKVWARDGYGVISGPATLSFVITPAPWRSWWAYLLYTLGLVGLVFAGFQLRVRTLNRRNEVLEAGIRERTAEIAETVRELEISEQHALEEKQKAIEANRAKTQFLANMSHELRTPLNAILGFVQLMQKSGTLGEEEQQDLAIIRRSSENLLTLILDLLTVSRIEAGTVVPDEHPFDLRQMAKGVEEMFAVAAHEKGLTLRFEITGEIPPYVSGDEKKLRQVLIKLVANAVKYTRRGGIDVRIAWNDGRAAFEVADTGHGIPAEERERIFSAFVQGASHTRYHEGAGVGLTISHSFVRLMGGELTITSEVGEGTRFAFEVPLPAASGTDVEREHRRVVGLEPGQAPPRILVADDKWENRALLGRMLASVGFEVREVVNGDDAIEAWNDWGPDMIWMDTRMPGTGGVDAARAIREREDEGRRCCIIAVATSEYEQAQESFSDAGFDGLVVKPFLESEIFDVLASHLGVRYVYQDPSLASAAHEGTNGIDREALADLPDDLLRRLQRSLEEGDVESAIAAIEPLRASHPDVASAFEAMVKSYRVDELLDLIEGRAGT